MTARDEAHIRKPLKEIAEVLDGEASRQVHHGAIVRAGAGARAQRDEPGRITLHPREHADRVAVSQGYAWRFKPMQAGRGQWLSGVTAGHTSFPVFS